MLPYSLRRDYALTIPLLPSEERAVEGEGTGMRVRTASLYPHSQPLSLIPSCLGGREEPHRSAPKSRLNPW